MTELPPEIIELVKAGPLAHLSTVNADGSPQVTVIWIGLRDGQIFSGHMNRHLKLRNIERDPRVVLSFISPRDHGTVMSPYAVLKATATVQPSDETWDLLNGLAKLYMTPQDTFPAPKGPGYLVHYEISSVGGVGPWKPRNVGDAGR